MAGLSESVTGDFDRRKRRVQQGLSLAAEFLVDEIKATIRRKGLVKTGRLYRSITAEVSTGRAVVMAPVEHAGYLEEGTRKMRARPFFHETIRRNLSKIKRLILGG